MRCFVFRATGALACQRPDRRAKMGGVTMPKATINNARILLVALLILALDQLTKWIVIQRLPRDGEPVAVVDGFFEFLF